MVSKTRKQCFLMGKKHCFSSSFNTSKDVTQYLLGPHSIPFTWHCVACRMLIRGMCLTIRSIGKSENSAKFCVEHCLRDFLSSVFFDFNISFCLVKTEKWTNRVPGVRSRLHCSELFLFVSVCCLVSLSTLQRVGERTIKNGRIDACLSVREYMRNDIIFV